MNSGTTSSINLKDRPTSRIETDVENIRAMVNRVESITAGIVRHARALGYYEPTTTDKTPAPTPVITTLADAHRALDIAIDHCSGSLNVFD